ncbi:MAG: hypothetical protein V4498_01250 [candidate division FCPU426 bacterium]
MGWQEITALVLVALAAWALVRKMRGKFKGEGDCEGCAPPKKKK